MRVLFIHATKDRASEYQIHRTLAEHADPDRIDCFFVWQDSTHDVSRRQPASVRPGRNYFHDFGRNLSLSPKPSRLRRALMMGWRLPLSLLFLIRVVRVVKPDLLYTSQQSYEVLLTRLIRLVCRVPNVIHVNYVVGPWLGRTVLNEIRRADYTLACSNFIESQLIANGVPSEKSTALYNAADISRFTAPTDREATRSRLGLSNDAPLIISVGRLDPSKGFLSLLDAVDRLRREVPDVHLLICGATTTRDGYDKVLQSRVSELALNDHVTFAGARHDVASIMAASDVFCLPTVDEPFGLVFVEAMAAGLPVVALHSGGVPEIVQDERTGLLSPVDDDAALASNLLRILSDRELAARLGAAGKDRALTVFSPSRLAEHWADLLGPLVA